MIKPKKITVFREMFKGQDIRLDGHHWEDCTFENCNIILEKGYFDIINCNFQNCRLTLDGEAIAIAKVIDMFQPEDKKLKFNE